MDAPIASDQNAVDRAVSFLNEQFGSDIKNLDKAKQLYEQVELSKLGIEQRLSSVNSNVPDQLDSAVSEAESSTRGIERLTKEQAQLGGDIRNLLINSKQEVNQFRQITEKIGQVQKYAAYLQRVGQLEDLSSDIQSALIIDNVDLSVRRYVDLLELVKALEGSQCTHLLKYANDTLLYWYKILKDKFAGEFSDCLRAWGWPFIVVTTKAIPLKDAAQLKDKLEPLFSHLIKLQLPDGLLASTPPPLLAELPEWRPLLLPLQLMLKPLAARFHFHFYGNKQTNSIDKPEWYLTQVLTWIRDHRSFLDKHIQPLLDVHGYGYADAVCELSRGLVLLVMEKMLTDIPELLYDDHQFSHLIDEALAFDKELREAYGYGPSQPTCLHTLLREEAFNKWIRIERKFAMEKMDQMMSSESAWLWQYKDVAEADELRIPECGEAFLTLMLTMTERYRPLPSPRHKLQFLAVQMELLEDFRARLAQVKSSEGTAADPLGHTFSAILNTVSYMQDVLTEWREMTFFLQLQYYKTYHEKEEKSDQSLSSTLLDDSKLSSTMERSVFDGMIELLQHMKNEMLGSVVSYVVDDVKARSRPYRNDKWMTLASQKELGGIGLALSASACEMLLVLKGHLHHVQTRLSNTLFESFWQKVATALDNFIFTEVILANHFNEGGAAQLNFDMTRNLFPLFGQHTSKPENYFKDVKEACILLGLKAGSVKLLKEVLYQALHEPSSDPYEQATDPVAALHDMGVFKISLENAELVLSLRTDV